MEKENQGAKKASANHDSLCSNGQLSVPSSITYYGWLMSQRSLTLTFVRSSSRLDEPTMTA